MAQSYFKQIPDVTRDQATTQKALDCDAGDRHALSRIRNMSTMRASKIVMTRDQLAGKEMQIGRYYLERREYIAAINRFKTVVTQYQDTRHVEEALERLVEANLAMGLVGEAQTAAAVLGHNFPDSRWYKDAYNLLQEEGRRARRQWRRGQRGVPQEDGLRRRPAPRDMLVALAIRDIVLIDRLAIDFAPGMTVLTGETGAGKSILLDALSLALGGRGDSALVRHGAGQGRATSRRSSTSRADHPVRRAARATAASTATAT